MSCFDAIELDWKTSALRLHSRNSFTAATWAQTVDGLSEVLLRQVPNGLLTLTIHRVGSSVDVIAVLDSGSTFCTFNHAAARALGLREDHSAQPMWVSGVGGGPLMLRVADQPVDIEAVTSTGACAALGKVTPVLGDLPAFAQLGLASTAACILGLDALMQRPRAVLSTSTRRLLI
jgi:hypothetical protein